MGEYSPTSLSSLVLTQKGNERAHRMFASTCFDGSRNIRTFETCAIPMRSQKQPPVGGPGAVIFEVTKLGRTKTCPARLNIRNGSSAIEATGNSIERRTSRLTGSVTSTLCGNEKSQTDRTRIGDERRSQRGTRQTKPLKCTHPEPVHFASFGLRIMPYNNPLRPHACIMKESSRQDAKQRETALRPARGATTAGGVGRRTCLSVIWWL
jgi:hypothetical protein